MKVIKGIDKGEMKKRKTYPKDKEKLLQVLREENKEALEQLMSKRELSIQEKFENAIREAFKKSLKPVTSIPETAVKIPIELFLENLEDTVKLIWAEAKFNASEKRRGKFIHKRKPGEPSKPRNRKSPKKEAFIKWVKDHNIDPNLSLDRLTFEVDEAYRLGDIDIIISRDTVNKCLSTIRKKK
jgi:hypothetical protein